MDDRHEISETAWKVFRYFLSCLILTAVIYLYTRKAETIAYEVGLTHGKQRYWDSYDARVEMHKRRQAAATEEKVEGKSNG